jgi:hypothetical protein
MNYQATQTQYEIKGTIMKTVTRSTTAVLLGVLIAAPFASAQENSKHGGTVETRRLAWPYGVSGGTVFCRMGTN